MDLQGTRCHPVAAAAAAGNATLGGSRLGGERSRGRAALGKKCGIRVACGPSLRVSVLFPVSRTSPHPPREETRTY